MDYSNAEYDDYGYDYGCDGEDDYGMDSDAGRQDSGSYAMHSGKNSGMLMANLNHELLDKRLLKENLANKMNSMDKNFRDFNLDPGDYWNYLRQLNFNVKDASGRLEEKIIDLMETKVV